jgi:hypothetical protein
MCTPISFWFQRLFRPKITTVKVILLENGKEKNISAFPEYMVLAILKSINEIFSKRDSSHFWFETAVYEKTSNFGKKKMTEILSTCYTENSIKPETPKPTNIPQRYRWKIFDTYHHIQPILPNGKTYSGILEVKFIIPK